MVSIIEDEERGAFERLDSDAERDRFIQEFWERRDPTPGTSANEAKDEHYRRIAYTERRQRWADEEGVPAWRSDRGRIYIGYGPPDAIEAHPSGQPHIHDGKPFEIWRYRKMTEDGARNLILIFVQDPVSGAYRVMQEPR